MLDRAAILNFRPTPEMKRITEILLIAMAHRDTVSPVVLAYQKKILEEGDFKVSPSVREYAPDRPDRITDPARTYLLGDEDARRYYAACNEARKAAKLHVDNEECCPKLVSESRVIDAENELMRQMKPLTGLDAPWSMDLRRKYLDILIKMMLQHIDPQAAMQRMVGTAA